MEYYLYLFLFCSDMLSAVVYEAYAVIADF